MGWKLVTGVVYAAIIVVALWINVTWAQAVPKMVDGAWVLPARETAAASAASPGGGYTDVAYEACAYHGCSGDWLVSIMMCESGGDHGAVGPNGERGVMQYHPQGMWPEMAWAGPVDQIWHAAWAISNGYSGHWVCS